MIFDPATAATLRWCAGGRKDWSGVQHALLRRLWPRFAVNMCASRKDQRNPNINRVLHTVQAINPCVPVGKECSLASEHCYAGALLRNTNSLLHRLAPHCQAYLFHRRQGQALRALRGLDGASGAGAHTLAAK